MELSQYDDAFVPKEGAAQRGKFASDNAKLLADGTYAVKVSGGTLKEINGGPVVTITFVVENEGPFHGWPVEKAYFFRSKGGETDARKIQELRTDLGTLGVQTEGFVLDKHLAGAMKVIKGCELALGKKTGGDKGQYANLYVNKRSGTDGRPEKFSLDMLTDADAPGTGDDGSPLPF